MNQCIELDPTELKSNLEREIAQLKHSLELAVHANKFNFNHPYVLSISQKLDHLIVKAMRLP